ncbi:MAG: Ig-like domain-containing protein [Pseudomonadota bacterium]|nr:Ig-like domain-containing protein [Pseudomonadota bacterium]
MRLLPFALPLVTLLACSGDSAKDDTGPAPACAVTLEETVPVDAATDAYYRGAVEFPLSDPDPLATVSASFAGTLTRSEDGTVLSYTPDAPLTPNTAYTATLESCAGSTEIAFTTSGLGTALADPAALIGRTWSFDLAAARLVSPEGMNLVLSSVPQQPLLIGVTAVDADTLDIIEGSSLVVDGEPLTQEYCFATTDLPGAEFAESPYFHLSAAAATVAVGGAPVTVSDLVITGTFSVDGTFIGGGTLSGILDTRNMGVLVGDEGNPSAACDLMVSAGIRCGDCPDGERYCLDLLADQITAPEVAGFTVTPVAGVDCEGCADGPPAEDAVCAE